MIRAEIITQWVETSYSGKPLREPKAPRDHTLSMWVDTTEQQAGNIPPDPNLLTILVECSEAVFADIEADADIYVMWSETIEES